MCMPYKNKEDRNRWQREWAKTDVGKKSLELSRGSRTRAHKKYRQSLKGKIVARRKQLKLIQKYPEKWAARRKVTYALSVKKLIKLPCEKCGDLKSFAHHVDYSKPLEVIWLCQKHHREAHDNKS